MVNVLYWLMISALFTHELDAVKRHEWRVLPLTSSMPDKVGEQVFIWLHVPLFFVLIWMSLNGAWKGLPLTVSAFAIIHVGLHWMFRRHPDNEFNNVSSWTLIILTGLLGALHLASVALLTP